MTFQSVWRSEACPDDLCQYLQKSVEFDSAQGEDIYSILHNPCDSCANQTEQEPLQILDHRHHEDVFSAFRRHLENYTARSLTLESDTVDAFKGVLTVLYDGDLGIYGLPVNDFDRAMLWHVLEELPTSASGKESFPSWSWASAGSTVTIPVQSWGHFMGPLVHWTYKSPNGKLKAINSSSRPCHEEDRTPRAYLLAAWWNGCVEAPVPDDVKHASTPICSKRTFAGPVQRYWIQRLCEHLVKRETCEECESYIEHRWPSLDQLWNDINQSASRQGLHEPSFGFCMVDPLLTENLHPGALWTRAQTTRLRIGKKPDPTRGDYWRFVDAAGRRVGDILPLTERTTATRLQAALNGDSVECIGVSLIRAFYSGTDNRYYETDCDWPGVNVIIIDQQERYQTARRIGVGWIYLWDWVQAGPKFRDIILE
ncbi:hypothetical protein F4779DRAFT_621400 [Xylariaceae sp. FL0662B]|nr:hypothetical protein F4779DRAFT_621400 [Xylariaceae sp. FL0662B]